jgi:FMN phosphatase YigB (HAD superfamily)
MSSAMLKAILFDLDDTLLGNDMNVFLPPYLQSLSAHIEPLLEAKRFVPALLGATRSTMASQDTKATNAEVFWQNFTALGGPSRELAGPFFDRFYREEFFKLAALTQPEPNALRVVNHCLQRGYAVVVATNPIFPKAAVEERLRWAGLGQCQFNLVTSYENMHSTKPHPEYYREILRLVDCAPQEALMVGNDPEQDIAPARAAGLRTLLVRSLSQRQGSEGPQECAELDAVLTLLDR